MITEGYGDGFFLLLSQGIIRVISRLELAWLPCSLAENFSRHAENTVHLARLSSKPNVVLRWLFLCKRRFLALLLCEYFYFALGSGQHLTVCLIASLAKLGL